MNFNAVFRSLGPIDIRSIRRDSLMPWMMTIALLMAFLIRWSVPPLRARVLEQSGFDIAVYYPVLLAYFFVGMTPMVFGGVIGFLLLDEKDDRTLTALQVTPLPLNSYLLYRVALPILMAFGMMFVVFPAANLRPFDLRVVALSALAAAPMASMFALFLAAFAENKVQGFALMKLAGVVFLAPVAAYFVSPTWEWLFALVPTYWPMKVYWLLEAGEANVWLPLAAAVVYQLLLTVFFARRFYKVLHQ